MHVLGARHARESQGSCTSMRRSIVETTLTARPSMRWRERCPVLPVPNRGTWRPSRRCARIWRNPGRRSRGVLADALRANPDGTVGGMSRTARSVRR